MKPQKPTIIFVPGARHTAAHFGPLSGYLESEDCESFSIRLPSTGEKAGTDKGELANDVAAIRCILEALIRGTKRDEGEKEDTIGGYVQPDADGGKELVLVMHSSGAVSGCQAINSLERSSRIKEGKRGGVISLVFIGGLLVNEGESLMSTMRGLGEDVLPEYTDTDGPILRPSNIRATFYSDLAPDQAAHWGSRLESQSKSVYTTVVRNTCWDLDIPITYITCTKDPQARANSAMVAKMQKANWSVRTIEAGHCPFLSCVEELGDLILKAGREGYKKDIRSM